MSTRKNDATRRHKKSHALQASERQQAATHEAAAIASRDTRDPGAPPAQGDPVPTPTADVTEVDSATAQGQLARIHPRLIHASPFQHRTIFDPVEMEELRKDIARNDIHTALIVRKHPTMEGQFELATGERRLRIALELEKADVPVIIRELTDRQVQELQWSENFRRVNPNPLNEASSLNQMLQYHRKVDGLARYIGKPRAYVVSRLQLLNLIPSFREMVHAGLFKFGESLEIATLAPTAQESFFSEYCNGWQEKKTFRLYNLSQALDRFRCNLSRAIFDTKDKDLVPEAGACTRCPFNSATFQSLFPESERTSSCNRLECFEKKGFAHLRMKLAEAIRQYQPDALVFYGAVSKTWQTLLDELSKTAEWPRYSWYEVDTVQAPEAPNRADYVDDEENEFDEEGFTEAQEEFQAEHDAYQQALASGNLRKALLLNDHSIECILVNPEGQRKSTGAPTVTVTAAAVQQAIKAGTETPQLLTAEMDRIRQRQQRTTEIAWEKAQMIVKDQLDARLKAEGEIPTGTSQDQLAIRLLIYQSLDFRGKGALHERLPFNEEKSDGNRYPLIDWLAQLTDTQVVFMARVATHYKNEATSPTSSTGKALVLISEGIGIDVAGIWADQMKIADIRNAKASERLAGLERRIAKLQAKKEEPVMTE
jgi:ParB family transcriptional regulator, chromosome partitioning protein